jgi:hypothetical protein
MTLDLQLSYCRRCDLAFCPQHVGNHMPHYTDPDQVPTREEAERVGATFCCQCVGLFAPPPPVPQPLWACTDNHPHPCNQAGYRYDPCPVLKFGDGFAAAHHCCDTSLEVFTSALTPTDNVGLYAGDVGLEGLKGLLYREGLAVFWIGVDDNAAPGEKYFTDVVNDSYISDTLESVARPLWHFIRGELA